MVIDAAQTMSTTVSEDIPHRILDRGPDYFRNRMLNRDSGFERLNRRSAVELLEETKPLYVKSDSVRHTKQCPVHQTSNGPGVHCKATCVENGSSDGPLQDSGPATTLPCASSVSKEIGDRKAQHVGFSSQTAVRHRLAGLDSEDGTHLSKQTQQELLSRGTQHTGRVASYLSRLGCGLSVRGLIPLADTHLNHSLGKPPPPPRITSNGHRIRQGNILEARVFPSAYTDWGDDFPSIDSVLQNCSSGSKTNIQVKHGTHYLMHKDPSAANGFLKRDMECSRPSKTSRAKDSAKTAIPTISTEDWQDTRQEASSDVEKRSADSSQKMEEGSNSASIQRRRTKSISRSRSDLTKRFSNSSDLSDLSSRFSRNSEDLEKFFNEMGLDRNVLQPMLTSSSGHAQSSSSLQVFDSISSIGSVDARSWCSDDSQRSDIGLKSTELEEHTPGSTSVVERNARIIKWLCNMKKAPSSPSLSHSPHSTD